MYKQELQLTFGESVGLPAALLPSRMLAGMRRLPDRSLVPARDDDSEFIDCEGGIHFDEYSRDAADADFVSRTFDAIAKGDEEYHTSGDGLDAYIHLPFEDRTRIAERAEEWIGEYYADRAGRDGWIKDVARELADEIRECDTVYEGSSYRAYMGTGLCLDSYELGEPESSVNVADIPEFAELHRLGRLEGLLSDYNGDAYINDSLSNGGPVGSGGDIGYSIYPGGQVQCVVGYDRARELVTEAILRICRGRN